MLRLRRRVILFWLLILGLILPPLIWVGRMEYRVWLVRSVEPEAWVEKWDDSGIWPVSQGSYRIPEWMPASLRERWYWQVGRVEATNPGPKFYRRLRGRLSGEELHLVDTDLTQQEVRLLSGWDKLYNLSLIGTERETGPPVEISGERIAGLDRLPALTSLQIGGFRIDAAGLEAVSRLPNLEYLRFMNGCEVDAGGLVHLTRSGQLKWLTIAGAGMNEEALSVLGRMEQLVNLDVGPGCEVEAAGIHHLFGLSKLYNLRIDGARLQRNSLEGIGVLTNLKSLSLKGEFLDPDCLTPLAELSQLTSLTLQGVNPEASDGGMTYLCLEPLSALKDLWYVRLDQLILDEDAFQVLRELPSLSSLRIPAPPLSDPVADGLHGLLHLKALCVSSSPDLPEEALIRLVATLPALKVLALYKMKDPTGAGEARLSQAGIEKLQAARPDLEINQGMPWP